MTTLERQAIEDRERFDDGAFREGITKALSLLDDSAHVQGAKTIIRAMVTIAKKPWLRVRLLDEAESALVDAHRSALLGTKP